MMSKSLSLSFDQPLEMLMSCHERIGTFCEMLVKLQVHLVNNSVDLDSQQAAKHILCYFETAAKHHQEDEEQAFFPPLLKLSKQIVGVAQLIESLKQEHQVLARSWTELQTPLQQIAQGEPAVLNKQAIEAFVVLYTEHTAKEEQQLFNQATEWLSTDELRAMSKQMVARRTY